MPQVTRQVPVTVEHSSLRDKRTEHGENDE
jgi:hypothetical protein